MMTARAGLLVPTHLGMAVPHLLTEPSVETIVVVMEPIRAT